MNKLRLFFATSAICVLMAASSVAADRESGKPCCSSDFNAVAVVDTSAIPAEGYKIEIPTGDKNSPIKEISLEGLVDQNGDTLTPAYIDEHIMGNNLWVYYGFSTCTQFCPTSIDAMRVAYQGLGSPDDLVLVIIASTGGETPESMKGMVQPLIDADIPVIALTGPDDRRMATYTRAVIVNEKTHSPVISLIGKDGKYKGGVLPLSAQISGYRPEPDSVKNGHNKTFGSSSGLQPVPGR